MKITIHAADLLSYFALFSFCPIALHYPIIIISSKSQSINFFQICIANAKTYLSENSIKKRIEAAIVFGIHLTILYTSIACDIKPASEKQRGENNKILAGHQEKAIYHFVQFLLSYSIQHIHEVVFIAVITLKHAYIYELESE